MMNGLLHRPADTASKPAAAQLLGILYAEDFDDPPTDDPMLNGVAEPQALTEEDVASACATAVAEARQAWEAGAAEQRVRLLEMMSAALADAKQQAEAVALATAEPLVTTILAMLAGMLPKFCEEHGPKEARALVDRLLPLLKAEPKIIVRVHADLVPGLRQDVLDIQPDFAGTITVIPAAIERSDVRVAWENGSLTRDTRQILQAMQDALGQLGLQLPAETTPKRKLAYAE